jgi:hypothetical protein
MRPHGPARVTAVIWAFPRARVVDAGEDGTGTGDLQETCLPVMGDGWSTQNLTTTSPPSAPPI